MTTVILFSAASTSSLSSSSLSSSLSLCLYILLITVVPIIVIGNWLQLVVRQRQSDVPVDLTTFPAVDPLPCLAYPTQHYCPSLPAQVTSPPLHTVTPCHTLPHPCTQYTFALALTHPHTPLHLPSFPFTLALILALTLTHTLASSLSCTFPNLCPHTSSFLLFLQVKLWSVLSFSPKVRL